jgi:NAD(P)-dependent dehydrogenase (short-subunit alcohol dehydrogenase family)
MATKGKTAVVTGAARGIGRELCVRLAREGANVVAVDVLDCAETLSAMSGPGDKTSQLCDVSSSDDVTRLKLSVEEGYGRCDILVNNAAIFPVTPFDDLTIEVFRRVMAVNVDAMLLLALAFAPGMKAAGWGRIVNMGSVITMRQNVDRVPYMTSKGAVHALTRALANELGASGITVNALAPSVVPTEGLYSRATATGGMTHDQELELVASAQTIKRLSTGADVANTLAFVVSDDADLITGQILHISGGLARSGA